MQPRKAAGLLFAAALALLGCGRTRAPDAADVYAAASAATYLVLCDVRETEWGLEENTLSGWGTGVGYREDGWVVTAGHVINEAAGVQIRAPDGSVREADRWAWDGWADVGVVHVPDLRVEVPELGDADRLRIGEPLYAVGLARVLAQPVLSAGVVSGLHRSFLVRDEDLEEIQDLIQTDAQLNPGNSGGGLFRADGRLVGLATKTLSKFDKTPAVSFGIPLRSVLRTAQDLVERGEVEFRALGVGMLDTWRLGAKKRAELRIDASAGVVVTDPGPERELQIGDWIVAVDGRPVQNFAHYEALVRFAPRARAYRLGLRRRGVALDVALELGQRTTSSRRGRWPEEWRR